MRAGAIDTAKVWKIRVLLSLVWFAPCTTNCPLFYEAAPFSSGLVGLEALHRYGECVMHLVVIHQVAVTTDNVAFVNN